MDPICCRPLPQWTAPCALRGDELSHNISLSPNSTESYTVNNLNVSNAALHLELLSTSASSKRRRWTGYALALLTGVCGACCYQAMKNALQTSQPWAINFWIGLVGTVLLSLTMFAFELPLLRLLTRLPCIGYFLVVVVIQYQLSSAYCLQYMNPSVYALIRALQLPLLFVVQWLLSGVVRPPQANWVEVAGAVVCFIAVCVGPVVQLVKERREIAALNHGAANMGEDCSVHSDKEQ